MAARGQGILDACSDSSRLWILTVLHVHIETSRKGNLKNPVRSVGTLSNWSERPFHVSG